MSTSRAKRSLENLEWQITNKFVCLLSWLLCHTKLLANENVGVSRCGGGTRLEDTSDLVFGRAACSALCIPCSEEQTLHKSFAENLPTDLRTASLRHSTTLEPLVGFFASFWWAHYLISFTLSSKEFDANLATLEEVAHRYFLPFAILHHLRTRRTLTIQIIQCNCCTPAVAGSAPRRINLIGKLWLLPSMVRICRWSDDHVQEKDSDLMKADTLTNVILKCWCWFASQWCAGLQSVSQSSLVSWTQDVIPDKLSSSGLLCWWVLWKVWEADWPPSRCSTQLCAGLGLGRLALLLDHSSQRWSVPRNLLHHSSMKKILFHLVLFSDISTRGRAVPPTVWHARSARRYRTCFLPLNWCPHRKKHLALSGCRWKWCPDHVVAFEHHM